MIPASQRDQLAIIMAQQLVGADLYEAPERSTSPDRSKATNPPGTKDVSLTTFQCTCWIEKPWPGHVSVLRRWRCRKLTKHKSRLCHKHRPYKIT